MDAPKAATAKTPRGILEGWRFKDLFQWSRRPDEGSGVSDLASKLRSHYPSDAEDIIKFMTSVLERREAIVERLKKHPELNDHGFFMVLCLMYIATYRGIGYSSGRLVHFIELFATSNISIGTAARKLQKANDVELFVTDRDALDSRKQRYFLHEDMIRIFSDTFGGMIDDVRAADLKDGQPEAKAPSDSSDKIANR
jgi:hypothetical protein